jgi:hypothetical protein
VRDPPGDRPIRFHIHTPAPYAVRRTALKLLSHATRSSYLRRERGHAARVQPLSVLVSTHPAWEPSIARGFAGLPHRLHFGDLALADLDRFDLIVPLSLQGAGFIRRQHASIRARAVPLPDEACAALCHEKTRLNEKLVCAGFSSNIPAMGEHVQPPFVFKPISGENSDDCILVPDHDSMQRLREELERTGMFRQTAVPGACEYATHFLMQDGHLVRELTVRYHHDAPLFIKGSATQQPAVRTLGACPDPDTLMAMLRCIDYSGVGCANYKMVNGCLQLLEINPRIGGSLGEYLFSFLRSLPQADPARRRSCKTWTWLDSATDYASLGGA